MSCGRSAGISNCGRSRWMCLNWPCPTHTVQQHHEHFDDMIRNSDQDKAWPPNTPGAREAEGDIQQLTPTPENNTQGLGEQMHNSNDVTQRCPQRLASPTSNYQFCERYNTTHMVIEGEINVKIHAKDAEVGLCANGNPRQDQVTMGRVHSPGSTNNYPIKIFRRVSEESLECYGTPVQTLEGMRGICCHEFSTDNLQTCIYRIILRYMY